MSIKQRRAAEKFRRRQIDRWVAPETHVGTESRTFRDAQQRDTKRNAKRSVFTGAGKRNVPVRRDGTPRDEHNRECGQAHKTHSFGPTPGPGCDPAALSPAPQVSVIRADIKRSTGHVDSPRKNVVRHLVFINPLGLV